MSTDIVIPFVLEKANYRGKLVKLDSVIKKALSYTPDLELPYKTVYAELITIALTLAADSKFPVNLKIQFIGSDSSSIKAILIDCNKEGHVRSLIQLNEDNIKTQPSFKDMVKEGKILIHLDQGLKEVYQSVLTVQDSDINWSQLFQNWFINSDQISTILKAVFNAEEQSSIAIFLQKLPINTTNTIQNIFLEDIENTLNIITATVQETEIVLSAQEILYRLYHNFEVRVFDSISITYKCNCSPEKIASMLKLFTAEEIADIRNTNNGHIIVKCTFCGETYKL